MDTKDTIHVIHIGKCGGMTVRNVLQNNNIKQHKIHIEKPIFNKKNKYVIVIRNPIKRLISAFNWRYKLVVVNKTQQGRFAGENHILSRYENVNEFAENIANFNVNKTYIHHIKEDINHYLGDFLKVCPKENILGVITTEYLNSDLERLFGVHNNVHTHKNTTVTDTYISSKGYENLKRYLHKDYKCIEKLFAMGCLTQEQYNALV